MLQLFLCLEKRMFNSWEGFVLCRVWKLLILWVADEFMRLVARELDKFLTDLETLPKLLNLSCSFIISWMGNVTFLPLKLGLFDFSSACTLWWTKMLPTDFWVLGGLVLLEGLSNSFFCLIYFLDLFFRIWSRSLFYFTLNNKPNKLFLFTSLLEIWGKLS